MKKANKALSSGVWMLQSTAIAILLAASAGQSDAQTYNLSSQGTSLLINAGGANAGVSDWVAGGADQLAQQWFYYSVGPGNVNSIDTISPFSVSSQSATSLAGGYSNSTVNVTTTYTIGNVTQGSSQLSSLNTVVTIQNTSGSAETLNLYQYSHFTVGGDSANQDVVFSGTAFPYTVYQYNQGNPGIYLKGSFASVLGATVYEAAGLYNGSDLGLGENLPPPNFNGMPSSAGPGDVNFGYEFTATLAPQGSIAFNEIQTVPEPAPVALISSALLALSLFKGRKLVFKKKL